jgi:cytochrome c biogenesis protein CcmG/thiol:disulfide interchange protein DsbE
LPLIQKAHERFQNDPKVKFILVSVDDDPKRLDRYVEERKFAFPVLRGNRDLAAEKFNVLDVPATFYIDSQGIIQYEARGGSPFGESVERVTWFIEELRQAPSAQP